MSVLVPILINNNKTEKKIEVIKNILKEIPMIKKLHKGTYTCKHITRQIIKTIVDSIIEYIYNVVYGCSGVV